MTVSVPTACPICHGTGVQPILVDADSEVGRLVAQAGIRVKLAGGPCLSCRCFCGLSSLWLGGLCESHDRESWIEDDTRARRRADA